MSEFPSEQRQPLPPMTPQWRLAEIREAVAEADTCEFLGEQESDDLMQELAKEHGVT